jgi:ABC-type sugar transport system ATPase subunit
MARLGTGLPGNTAGERVTTMDGSNGNQYVAEMRDIVKTFPGVRALNHVDFRIRAGEIHGLVGKNGAGKSTLMNVLTGIYQPDQGDIRVGGTPIQSMTTHQAKLVGIAYVHQRSQLIPWLSIAENVFCGSLPTGRGGFVDWPRLYREANERLRQLGLDIDVRRRIEGLSVAERQILEIAKALFAQARVIILDEATAPLPKDEVDMLFGFVRRQREQGVGFIYISHHLEEVFEICDSVTVLRDGGLVGSYRVSELDQAELVRLISGSKVERFERARRTPDVKPMLQIEGLTRAGVYDHLNLTLRKGEVVGLTGLEGCGKAELARALFGMEPLGEGKVLLGGSPYSARHPEDALAHGVAYLPRDRHGLGIIGIRPVRENITLPILRQLVNALGLIRMDVEHSRVVHFVDALGIKTPSLNQPVEYLSGGNQQKVVFAKLASTSPRVLLLNEPTQGVDVQAKVEIMRIVDRMSEQGVAVVYVSEEIRELLDICDRIVVIYGGQIVAEFDPADPSTTAEKILLAVEGSSKHHEPEKACAFPAQ